MDQLKLTIHPSIQESTLTVAYEVENLGDAPACLANGITDWFAEPQGGAATTRAYVNHGAEGLVVLLQGVVHPPPDVSAFGRTALFTRVAPGETFSTEIVADLPLLEWDAFNPPSQERAWPVDVERLELLIDTRLAPTDVFEHPSYGDFVGVGGGTVAVLTASVDLPRPVQLLRRVKDFNRFFPRRG